jgi:hypothetical protein
LDRAARFSEKRSDALRQAARFFGFLTKMIFGVLGIVMFDFALVARALRSRVPRSSAIRLPAANPGSTIIPLSPSTCGR